MSTTNNSALAEQSKKIDRSIIAVGVVALTIIVVMLAYVPVSNALGLLN